MGVIFKFFGYAIAFNERTKMPREEHPSANINQHQRDVFIMIYTEI